VPVAGTAIAAAIAAMLKGGAASAGGDLGKLIEGLKRLFGHGAPSTVQGDKPYAGGALMGPNTTGSGLPSAGPSWATGLPWEQPFLTSDPGYFTGFTGTPSDPSGGSGVGPGMQRYYNSYTGGSSEPVDWWKP
jgi:hypothetical protein